MRIFRTAKDAMYTELAELQAINRIAPTIKAEKEYAKEEGKTATANTSELTGCEAPEEKEEEKTETTKKKARTTKA